MNLLQDLNYNLYTDTERAAAVSSILKQNEPELIAALDSAHRKAGIQGSGTATTSTSPLRRNQPSAYTQLEKLADYILYGKDSQKLTNLVQQKRILKPQTIHSSYNKKTAESLEALQESPDFPTQEASLKPYEEKNSYTNPRPVIKRPSADGTDCGDSDIPGMVELWDSIDKLEHQLRIWRGQVQPATEEEKAILTTWTSLLAYRKNHLLIDLRKHQYYLKNHYKPFIPAHHSFPHTTPINWFSNAGYWTEATGARFEEDYKKHSTNHIMLTRIVGFTESVNADMKKKNVVSSRILQPPFFPIMPARAYTGGTYYDCTNKLPSYYAILPTDNSGDHISSPFSSLWHFLCASGGENIREDRWYCYLTYEGIDFRIQKNYCFARLEYWHQLQEHRLDLTNPDHIYQLFQNYSNLKESSYDDTSGQMKYIMMTLDDLQDLSELTLIQQHILDRKVLKYTNERIKDELKEMFNVDYNVNYISTLYKATCKQIAETAKLQDLFFQYKDDPSMWKTCTCCGKRLLRDPHFFVRKNENRDGLAARCKKCDKKIRDRKV
jgi:hypothetical protein